MVQTQHLEIIGEKLMKHAQEMRRENAGVNHMLTDTFMVSVMDNMDTGNLKLVTLFKVTVEPIPASLVK